jgi:hypothetical protein
MVAADTRLHTSQMYAHPVERGGVTSYPSTRLGLFIRIGAKRFSPITGRPLLRLPLCFASPLIVFPKAKHQRLWLYTVRRC